MLVARIELTADGRRVGHHIRVAVTTTVLSRRAAIVVIAAELIGAHAAAPRRARDAAGQRTQRRGREALAAHVTIVLLRHKHVRARGLWTVAARLRAVCPAILHRDLGL